jgi:ketosteroid isomerase-like protein
MSNLAMIQGIYAAFGRGDVGAIIDRVTDDVQWEYGVNATDVPWLQPRRGKDGARDFFATLAALDIHRFAVKRLLEDGDLVVAVVDLDATVKATGRRIVEEDEVHLWYFNHAGEVVRFRHRVDTHQHWAAYRKA